MKAALSLLALSYFITYVLATDYTKPKNGDELEHTLRTELNDIWVTVWYADQGGDSPDDAQIKFNEKNAEVQTKIGQKCDDLSREFKFTKADLNPDKQIDADNPDRDTDFKKLMVKLKVDDAKYTNITKGPIVSVIYRLNGVKVNGEDLETYVCDYISIFKD